MTISFEIRWRNDADGETGKIGPFLFDDLEEAEKYAADLNIEVPERSHWPALVIEREESDANH